MFATPSLVIPNNDPVFPYKKTPAFERLWRQRIVARDAVLDIWDQRDKRSIKDQLRDLARWLGVDPRALDSWISRFLPGLMPVFGGNKAIAVSALTEGTAYVWSTNATTFNSGTDSIGAAPTGPYQRRVFAILAKELGGNITSVLFAGSSSDVTLVNELTYGSEVIGWGTKLLNSGTSLTITGGWTDNSGRGVMLTMAIYFVGNDTVVKGNNGGQTGTSISAFSIAGRPSGAGIAIGRGDGASSFAFTGANEVYDANRVGAATKYPLAARQFTWSASVAGSSDDRIGASITMW